MNRAKQPLRGSLKVPGDKSISHRALIFAALSEGRSSVSGLSPADDVRSTINCLKALGLRIEAGSSKGGFEFENVTIESGGTGKLKPSKRALDAGNSGTTIRLMAGLAAGLPFATILDGDDSLRKRPMSRVSDPLRQMGAQINYKDKQGFPPFSITGGNLHGINYQVPVASAQVQTALVLAGLFAEGETAITVPGFVRDHTDRLLKYLGIPHASRKPGQIIVKRLPAPIAPYHVDVPADISSAAFFMVGAALIRSSSVELKQVGINPGRRLVIDVLQKMGADISVKNQAIISGEPVADIAVNFSQRLKGASISAAEIASGIDEIPILALAGALSDGIFSVRGAAELRIKESNRLEAIVNNLAGAGAKVTQFADGFDIEGQASLPGGSNWTSFGDHRLAMTGLIAGLATDSPVLVDDCACASVSYPSFEADLAYLID